jgi:hypothetical protein
MAVNSLYPSSLYSSFVVYNLLGGVNFPQTCFKKSIPLWRRTVDSSQRMWLDIVACSNEEVWTHEIPYWLEDVLRHYSKTFPYLLMNLSGFSFHFRHVFLIVIDRLIRKCKFMVIRIRRMQWRMSSSVHAKSKTFDKINWGCIGPTVKVSTYQPNLYNDYVL